MRMGDGGFISTVDTIVALEALVTYSYNNRINDITELNVEVELPDSNITENVTKACAKNDGSDPQPRQFG